MKNISCKIIEDLLPLYNDNVCSKESKQLVEEHLESCIKCQELLKIMKTDVKLPIEMDNAAVIKRISKKWKSDKTTSFLSGICLVSFLTGVASFIMYNIRGSYVAEDGRVVEAFGFIPIGFLFLFISLIFGLTLAIRFQIRRFFKNRTADR